MSTSTPPDHTLEDPSKKPLQISQLITRGGHRLEIPTGVTQEKPITSGPNPNSAYGSLINIGPSTSPADPEGQSFKPCRARVVDPALKEHKNQLSSTDLKTLYAMQKTLNDNMTTLIEQVAEISRRLGRLENILPNIVGGESKQPFIQTYKRYDPNP